MPQSLSPSQGERYYSEMFTNMVLRNEQTNEREMEEKRVERKSDSKEYVYEIVAVFIHITITCWRQCVWGGEG